MKKKWIIIAVLVVLILIMSTSILHGAMLSIEDITDDLPRAGSYGTRSLSDIKYIVIHHSASESQTAYDYADFHIAKGWPGIGYHFVIDKSGKIWQTNALETVSYHVENNNTPSVGICLSGNLNEAPMTQSQKQSLKKLIRRLNIQLPGRQELKAHRDFKATDCPGSLTDLGELT